MRIKHRWAALDAENAGIEKARKEDNDFSPHSFPTEIH